jgi:predicted nuclease of predicted toxin-antitoxin system
MSPRNNWSFLVDENTSRTLVPALREAGFHAEHIYDAGLQGHPDDEIFSYAQMHQQTIITIDLDFANIIDYPPPHFGIVILRLSNSASTTTLIREVVNGLNALGDRESLANTLIIIEPGRLRIRR